MGMGTPWTPSSFADGLILALVSLACWGSWSNTAKDISKPFNDFYYDYTLGLLCLSLVAYATLGHAVFLAETGDGKGSATRVVAAWLAGALFNLANVLLIEGIRMAGLSVAFPVGIGLALVLGTLLTYFADGGAASTQSPAMLFAGVMFAFFAILAQVQANATKVTYEKLPDTAINANKAVASGGGNEGGGGKYRRGQFVCVLAGVTMSLWSPLSAFSMTGGGCLTPYSSFLVFATGVCCTTPLVCLFVRPLLGGTEFEPKFDFEAYARAPITSHGMGCLGGMVWALGTVSSLISGKTIGMALSYSIGQSAPMVATLWGLFLYKEFDGAPKAAWTFIGIMFMCYVIAIGLIAGSK
mmetsp:Transcript_56556/g.156485  ORF Transcript_56556/g.156485 Transcript_56556/m.156485 type:complete len:355 (+) Transcript_56556:170-1234(+)